MRVVGLDLAGMDKNDTGFCLLGDKIEVKLLHRDSEILEEINRVKPDLIAIDAPFGFPVIGQWRPGEAQLIKRGFNPVNTHIPSMALLVKRAIELVKILREKGYRVIEVYSKASAKILGTTKEPRKNKDEYEALLCALTGKAYLEGEAEDLDGIIVPK
jgi:predicted nuclease with RNAse H fold